MGSIKHRLEKLERADGLNCPGCGWPEVSVNLVWPEDRQDEADSEGDAARFCEVCARPLSLTLEWKDALPEYLRDEGREGGT